MAIEVVEGCSMIFKSQLDPKSDDFKTNAAALKSQVNDLKANLDRIALGGDEASPNKHL